MQGVEFLVTRIINGKEMKIMLVKKNRQKIFDGIPVAFVCKRGMYICNNEGNPLIVENFRSGKFRIWYWNGTSWMKADYTIKGKSIVSDTGEIGITARTYEQLNYLKTIM